MKHKILIATTNTGKIAELKAMLDSNVEWLGLTDFPDIGEVVEDGKTFAENARKKATEYAKAANCWAVADDSGLAIDALDGKPGIKSARFSGAMEKDRTLLDSKNMQKVLTLLKNVPKENRTAKFVCCLCLACPELVEGSSPSEILIEVKGEMKGKIAAEPIGENGFGYDPIFFIPELNKTAAQLSAEEKNAISHRGQAIRKLKPQLEKLLICCRADNS